MGGDSATESEEVVPEADASHDAGDDVEAAARELAEGGPGEHDVDTPFAWTEPEATPEASPRTDGPRIGEYFEGLLSWEPGEGS